MSYKKINTALIILFLITGNLFCQEEGAFNLLPGDRFIVSGWVKETHATPQKSYANSSIQVDIVLSNLSFKFFPSGNIIDGWQRIIGLVQVPETVPNGDELRIQLLNHASADCFFDDVRVFPYNGTMKSFVYESDTQRLVAELDENNNATFYEYDQEGGLIRVKKETENGVYTIQETRSNTKKRTQE